MRDLDRESVAAIGRVVRELSESESDSDHVSTIIGGWSRLVELSGHVVWPEAPPSEHDVQIALDLLDELDPSETEQDQYRDDTGRRHPDRYFGWLREFVDTDARYVNGSLPEPRTWTVVYRHDGDMLETRTYQHDDEIPLSPEIDDSEYESTRVSREEGRVVVRVESQ